MTEKTKKSINHGGDLVAQVLKAHGVKYVFTLCGGHISPMLIGCDNLGIDVVDVRDEKNAAFAADAISRLTDTPGVVAVTAGPGVTNTITAIKNAQLAGSPLIVLGGATATMLEGRGALQDIDQLGLLQTCTKWQTSVRKVKDIVPRLKEAFYQAQSDIPGPVFVELPVDILYPEEIVKEWYGKKSTGTESLLGKITSWYINRHLSKLFEGDYHDFETSPKQPQFPQVSMDDIERITKLLQSATKPVMLLSSQVMLDRSMLDKFRNAVESLSIPVFLSGMARGLLGKNHHLHIRHKRSKALREADVIILAGVPLDFRLDYGRVLNRSGSVIAINRDKDVLKMNRVFRGVDIKIHADPQLALSILATKMNFPSHRWKEWHETLQKRQKERDEKIHTLAAEETEFINPLALCQEIDQVMDNNSVIIADGGDFIATMSYIVQPRGPLRWLDPGPYGTLGVGAGFAMGAKLIYPESTIWLFYGDGAAGFSINEFDSFVRHGLPVIAIIGNDASWQQIAREQVELFDTPLSTELAYSDYHRVVEGYGATGFFVDNIEEVGDILQEAKKIADEGTPVLINFKIGKTDFRKGSISM